MKWALMPYGFTGCECARYEARGLAIGLAAAIAVAWALHQATALARFFILCALWLPLYESAVSHSERHMARRRIR